MFIFGATTFEQLIVNHSLVHPPFKTSTLVVKAENDFQYLYENVDGQLHYLCLQRKKFRKAMRTPVRTDEEGDTCKICLQRKACILIKPCNHLGICNSCSFKMFKHQFNIKTITKNMSCVSLYKCPFCYGFVDTLNYVFIV